MQPLYKIAHEYKSLMDQILECDELTEEHLAEIKNAEGAINDKAIAIGTIINNLDAEALGIQEGLKNMEQRFSRVMKKITGLKDYLKTNLEQCNIKEVKSPYFDIKIRNNPPSVIVCEESMIPPQYFCETLMRRLNKAILAQDLKNNIEIPGAYLAKHTRLEIR
jgi:Gp157 protein